MFKRITSPVQSNVNNKRAKSAPPKIEVPSDATAQAMIKPQVPVRPQSLPQLENSVPRKIPLTADYMLLLCIQLRQFNWVAVAKAYFSMQDEIATLNTSSGVRFNERQYVLKAAVSAVTLLRQDSWMIKYIVFRTCQQWLRKSQLLAVSGKKDHAHFEFDRLCSILLNEIEWPEVLASQANINELILVKDLDRLVRPALDRLVGERLRSIVANVTRTNPGVRAYYVPSISTNSQCVVDYLVFFPYYMNTKVMNMFNPLEWSQQQQQLCFVLDLFSLTAMPANKFVRLYQPVKHEANGDSSGLLPSSTQLTPHNGFRRRKPVVPANKFIRLYQPVKHEANGDSSGLLPSSTQLIGDHDGLRYR